MAFVVTDDDRRFQSVARQLPEGVEAVRLYESYLSNFRFTGQGVAVKFTLKDYQDEAVARGPHQPPQGRHDAGTTTRTLHAFSLRRPRARARPSWPPRCSRLCSTATTATTSSPIPARSCCGSPTTRA